MEYFYPFFVIAITVATDNHFTARKLNQGIVMEKVVKKEVKKLAKKEAKAKKGGTESRRSPAKSPFYSILPR